MLAGKKILIGVTGSIAAYKIPALVRLLVRAGAEVKIIMTPASASFVSPLTLSTVSKNEVLTELFSEATWANHVQLGRWADVMLIAPLSCNTLAKMAAGQCDNLLLAAYLSATCPVMAAPAMDDDMWHHPAVQANIKKLKSFGHIILEVGYGELASGLTGDGRMAEPEDITGALNSYLTGGQALAGKKVLITAGPTYEAIDPVRFIGNHSSGKMGYAIAAAFAGRGAAVTLVSGPVNLSLANPKTDLVKVTTAAQMYAACMEAADYDIAVMAAAVSDYAPVAAAGQKIKKGEEPFILTLSKTKDILRSLGEIKRKGQVLIGFALETNNERENALQKLADKNADLIVLNSLADSGAGFGVDTNKVSFLYRDGREKSINLKAKTALAEDIVNESVTLLSSIRLRMGDPEQETAIRSAPQVL